MIAFILMMMTIIISLLLNLHFQLQKVHKYLFKELIPSLHDCTCLDIVILNILHACFGFSLI